MKKLFILTTSDLPSHVILGHASFAKDAGLEPIFIFPDRGYGNKYDDTYKDFNCIKLKSKFNVSNYFTYLISIIKLTISLTTYLLSQKEVKLIVAVDFECTVACLFLKIKRIKIISLVNDNFSIRYNFNNYIISILKILESIVYNFVSDYCIFPDQIRLELLGNFKPKNVIIIENVLKEGVAKDCYIGNSENDLKILICGWLDESRGLELISDLINSTNNNVIFYLVGSGKFINNNPELLKNIRVKYLEHKTREETLEIMSKVDLNMAFYNPNILINRYALPQKVFDSILISCPCLINSEVEMSKAMSKAGAVISTPYFDTTTLANLLNNLISDKKILKNMSSNMKTYSKNIISYDQLHSKAVNFYKSLNKN